ncbi:hypothetical protein GE061_006118 [Apolygus lucorum]|uniref:Major facilitator superfamily associated domain-containing protein n=1 Tax=Apolygus lucorum TaxID=248454 RepID=A0A6A4IRG1_APOLU|nr:hypothetical protein GE061_006118 [Apolygus lucorum]
MPKIKINSFYLPVKCHYFFFMAAMGPILPYLPVYAKDLGMSEVAMGSVHAVLPVVCLLAKPFFGFILDFFSNQRKLIFVAIIGVTVISFASITFIPSYHPATQDFNMSDFRLCHKEDAVNPVSCSYSCSNTGKTGNVTIDLALNCTFAEASELHRIESCNASCEVYDVGLYGSSSFWALAVLSCVFMVSYNVSNSLSDAVCFDVLGEGNQHKYGHQRVFGTVGFGLSSLLGAILVNYNAKEKGLKKYLPAFILSAGCCVLDLGICVWKLKLPKMPQSESILKDVFKLCKKPQISIFLIFATCVGICDASIFYFLLWYLNDLATVNGTSNIKLLEGIVVAVETLCGELIFFMVSGKIIKKLGYANTFTLCFAVYSLRMVLIASINDPWWVVPIEAVFQGPTYALLYSTVVEYASAISPPGTSATTQGIVAGMDDGLGFAIGNVVAGFIYNYFGGHVMYYCYSGFALSCALIHFVLHRFVFVSNLEDHVETSPKHVAPVPEGITLLEKHGQEGGGSTLVRRNILADDSKQDIKPNGVEVK